MALKKNPKYDLKRKYNRTLELCVIISLVLLIGAFKYFPDLSAQENIGINAQELITMEEVVSTKQETLPPPPPKPVIPLETPSDEVLDDIEILDTELIENAVVDTPPPPPADDDGDEVQFTYFEAVEEPPAPIGGIAGIQAKIKYPDLAMRAGVFGMVTILAYVNTNGDVDKVEVGRGIGAGCDEEAMKAVLETKFKPGLQRGKAVPVRVSVPVRFVLK